MEDDAGVYRREHRVNPLEAVTELGRLGQAHPEWMWGGLALLPLLGGPRPWRGGSGGSRPHMAVRAGRPHARYGRQGCVAPGA